MRRVTKSPTSVQLLLTRNCNLKCSYCSAARFEEEGNYPELNTKEWINIMRRLKEIGVFNLDFSGGEIFIRNDIWQILETAAEFKFPKMKIFSNGILISDEVAKRLKYLNYKYLCISLDGDEESHDMLRGEGSYQQTVSGIHSLVNNGITPTILLSPLKSTYKKMVDMVDMVYLLGIREISFNSMHPTGRCRENYKDIFLNCFLDAEEFLEEIENLKKRYSDFKTNLPPVSFHNFSDRYYNYYKRKPECNKTHNYLKNCSAGHTSCNITADGWVIPCSELSDFKGGNIRERDILDIWRNSESFEKIRDLSNVSSTQIPYCRNCDYNVFCDAGCRADAYAVYGDLLAPSPFCPYWTEK
jgi:SynChlorMet cassette radical SAM/SPASM protein ScmE